MINILKYPSSMLSSCFQHSLLRRSLGRLSLPFYLFTFLLFNNFHHRCAHGPHRNAVTLEPDRATMGYACAVSLKSSHAPVLFSAGVA